MLVQNVWIVRDFSNGITFNKKIEIDFVPEQVILKQVIYSIIKEYESNDPNLDEDEKKEEEQKIAEEEEKISLLWSNLIGDNFVAFFNGITRTTDATFPLNKSVNGTYTFEVKNIDGSLSKKKGQFAILLQFIKP